MRRSSKITLTVFGILTGLAILLSASSTQKVDSIQTVIPTETITDSPTPSETPTDTPTDTPTPTYIYIPPTDTQAPAQSYTQSEPVYQQNTQVCAGATAMCNDGTCSYSQHRQGTCSHHGGVSVWY